MEGSGWIKLHRSIRDHWIFGNSEKLKWWIDMLLMANHKDNKILINNKIIVIKRGCHHTSIRQLAERWGVSTNTVTKWLQLLESDGMIKLKKDKNGTTYEVCNYAGYQDNLSSKKNTDCDTDCDTDYDTNCDTDCNVDRLQTRRKERKKKNIFRR